MAKHKTEEEFACRHLDRVKPKHIAEAKPRTTQPLTITDVYSGLQRTESTPRAELQKPEESPEPKDWRTIIIDRIQAEEYSFNLLGTDADVSPAVISRFVSGQRDITLATAQKLCEALDLVLVPRESLR